MINLLFTSAGRRVELIQEFIRAKHNRNIDGRVIGADLSDLAPALYFADKAYTLPAISDPEYITVLYKICKEENINLIIPTIDTELILLSLNVDLFRKGGIDILISSMDTLKICRNKMETYRFFKSIGIKTPESYGPRDEYQGRFPCFIKPNSGSSSINAYKVKNEVELEFFKYYIGDFILQELVEGNEYTIDVFCDFDGNPIFITPRIRIATRSGEVLKTEIIYDDSLIEKVMGIIRELKPKGPLTIQAIKNIADEEYYFIEINARFGGGCPLSMMAGADSASAVYDLLSNKRIEYKDKAGKSGVVYLRFDQNIALHRRGDGRYERA